MTNLEILDNLLEMIDNRNTRRTGENAIGQFLKWVDENYGGKLPEKNQVLHWRKTLAGISDSTWYQYWRWIEKYYSYIENPTQYSVRPIRDRTFRKDILLPEQVAAVTEHTYRKTETGDYGAVRNYCILQLLLYTGMRIQSIVYMNLEDIRDSINPQTQQPIYEIRLKLKGRKTKDHIAIVTNGAYQVLKHYLEIRKGQSSEAVFMEVYRFKYGKGNGRLSEGSVSRLIKTMFRECGIDNSRITAHSLRHTAATTALEGGASLVQVQEMLAHANIETTQRYNHMRTGFKAENYIEYKNNYALKEK